MSLTITTWPIVKSLLIASQVIGADPATWVAINPKQTEFLQQYFTTTQMADCAYFTNAELKSLASKDVNELNQCLAAEGFAIKLKPFESANSFGVVAIFKVLVEWLTAGTKTELTYAEQTYPAVSMTQDFQVFTPDDQQIAASPVAAIATKSGDTVYLCIADHQPASDFTLLTEIQQLKAELQPATDYTEVIFPMVDLNREEDLSWLLDLQTADNTWYVKQALQQTKFTLNEVGAKVASAVAVEIKVRSSFKPAAKKLLIDRPFYLWIERPGVSQPVFAAYLTPEVWRAVAQ